MSSPRLYSLLLILLLAVCFTIAAKLEPQFQMMPLSRSDGDVFKITLGEGRALFANEFYVKADAYYHSGYYPSMFDNKQNFATPHMAADTGAVASQNKGDDNASFRSQSLDWIDSFGRHFYPNRHTHLDEGGPTGELSESSEIGEILPWLKLSADLDPHNVQIYVVTAYWLRTKMHKDAEALSFLRQGLRNNPDSYEILYELGRLYDESHHDYIRARNVWELALRKWSKLSVDDKKQNRIIYEQITTHLGDLESKQGHNADAIRWFQEAQKASLTPQMLQQRIELLRQKVEQGTNTTTP